MSATITQTQEPTQPAANRSASRGAGQRLVAGIREYGIVVAFVVVFIALAIASPVFLTGGNLLNLVSQSAAVGVMACAVTLVFIAGGFDLSQGANFAVSAIVGAYVTNAVNPVVGILAALVTGTLLAAMNGVLATVGRINPFVATLATSLVFRGVALVLSGGFIIVITREALSNLSRTPLFGDLRAPVLIFALVALGCGFLLNRTVFGRHIYAVGGNAEAARLSGVPVQWVRGTTYALAGFAAGLAGILVASRTLTTNAQSGDGLEFDVIAAVLVGGTSVLGGSGAIWRTVLGVLLFGMIHNGFNLIGIDPVYNRVFSGVIIILAVGADAWARRERTL